MTTNVIVIVAVAILVGVYVSWRAGRLDRLHARVDGARAALDAALLRRSSVALELAACGLLDPATSLLLAQAAHDARAAHDGLTGHDARTGWDSRIAGDGRAGLHARAAGAPAELAESDLTRALRAALGQSGFRAALTARGQGGELVDELEAAAHQVFLARRFYNDAVAVTLAARRRRLVRVLRLAGQAPLPEFFEMEDLLVVTGEPGSGTDMPHLAAG